MLGLSACHVLLCQAKYEISIGLDANMILTSRKKFLDPERIHKQYEVRTLFMFLFLLLSDFQKFRKPV